MTHIFRPASYSNLFFLAQPNVPTLFLLFLEFLIYVVLPLEIRLVKAATSYEIYQGAMALSGSALPDILLVLPCYRRVFYCYLLPLSKMRRTDQLKT